MWRISIFPDELYGPAAGLERGLALARECGIEYIDLRTVNGHSFMASSDEELSDVRRLMARYGIRTAALGTPLFKCPLRGNRAPLIGAGHGFPTDLSYEDHLDLLPRAFELADRFETENVRCFPFWNEYVLDDVFEEVVDKLGRAADRAGAAGHRLYLENEQDCLVKTGVELGRVLNAIDSPHLTGIYDAGNSGRVGGTPYPDDYQALRGRIGHIHVKFQDITVRCGWPLPDPGLTLDEQAVLNRVDFWSQPDVPVAGDLLIGGRRRAITSRRTFVGLTDAIDIDYRAFLRDLRSDGYRGFLAIDTSYTMEGAGGESDEEVEHALKSTLADLRRLMAEVWADDAQAEGV
ncbi:MAG: TIM barrel protein [Propionibacteriaceae bacterium]|nr:TIM barrel protein [Propionibacteriaceae bacterium]